MPRWRVGPVGQKAIPSSKGVLPVPATCPHGFESDTNCERARATENPRTERGTKLPSLTKMTRIATQRWNASWKLKYRGARHLRHTISPHHDIE